MRIQDTFHWFSLVAKFSEAMHVQHRTYNMASLHPLHSDKSLAKGKVLMMILDGHLIFTMPFVYTVGFKNFQVSCEQVYLHPG